MTKPEHSDPFSQFSAMFQQYKLPGFDVQAILDARRKDVEALAAANRVAFGGMEALRDKQIEILRRALNDFQGIAQQFSGSPKEASANSTEVVQKALHQALADMQEIAQKTQQAHTEAYAIVTKRIEEAAKELKSSLEQPKQ